MKEVILSEKPLIRAYNGDCMDFMLDVPENHYDLAIVDPPYGIGASEKNSTDKKQSVKSATESKNYGDQKWDDNIPQKDFFDGLKRVSKNQVVWGANYYGLIGGMLFWDKGVTMPTYSKGELAWLSFRNSVDYYKFEWHGMIQQHMDERKETRIHPTQKPVQLYRWLLQNYAKEGDKILDTHGGSMSIAIACHMEGFDLDIIELDEDYFNDAVKRFKLNTCQESMF